MAECQQRRGCSWAPAARMDADFCARADSKLHGSGDHYDQSDLRTTPHRHKVVEVGTVISTGSECNDETSVNQLNKQPAIISCSAVSSVAVADKSLNTTCSEVKIESVTLPTKEEAEFCSICHQRLLDKHQNTKPQDYQASAQNYHHDHQEIGCSSEPICSNYCCCECRDSSQSKGAHFNNSDTNQLVAADHGDSSIYSNSLLFWKFLSNLSKSINQRRKSNCSTPLAPEVAGYLASKQQCASGNRDNIMNITKTSTTQATSFHDDTEAGHMMMEPMPGFSGRADQTAKTVVVAHDGPRLIKIVAPLPVDTVTHQVDDQGQQQHQPPAATGTLNQIKLSIATTTRTSVSSLNSCILSDTTSTSEVRLKWGKKMDFLLSIIGFAVDLANIWRFPYLVYKNGGGVFLIPYITMLIFGGIPLFFLELCLGQYVKKGPITVWNKICPSMKGVGYCSILISWYVSFYYNVLIAWSVYFIYRSLLSFGDKMPWEECDNSWNSKANCVSISQLKNLCSTRNESLELCRKDLFANVNVTSPASEFFVKELSQIDQSTGLEDMGYLRMELVVCLIIVYLLHYFSLFRGLETSGKVVWVTATAPYMILSILLVRGLFLPGASMGIKYYLSPRLEKLADPQVWIDAAGQVFYSIGVGFGVHLTYASFNSHNNNCYRDCLMTSAVNAATSVYSGLVVFVYLGYMAKNLGIEIDKVASEGYSLVFEVYPEALTTLPFARFWSILFFIMLLTLGIDSAVSNS